MLKVGITGGIGSGKTTVCKVFETLRVPVFYADDAAKELMNEDEELKINIQSVFGNDIYADGKLNRSKLAEKVFSDKAALEKLNNFVHPATLKKYGEWETKNSYHPYVLHEAAILFEAGVANRMNKVITVSAPEPMRIQRIILRDNVTEEAVRARMKNQWSEEDRNKRADYIIYNDELQSIIEQVMKIHSKLLNLSA